MRLTARTRQNAPSFLGGCEFPENTELWRVNWRQHGYRYCGIYVISPDNRWPCKIGISQNPVKRVISLQNAHWRRLDIVHYRYCNDINLARAVEQKAHHFLREDGKLMQGEWFDVRPHDAVKVVDFAAGVVGIELRTDIPDDKIAAVLEEFNLAYNNDQTTNMKFTQAVGPTRD